MFAAAEGKSRLGIPRAVGEEFVAKDATAGVAAGIMFVAPDGDILLLRRRSNDENWAGHWDLPGGKGADGETPEQVAVREAGEETGIEAKELRLLDSVITPRGMGFHTFVQPIDTKLAPTLSEEHSGFAWAPLDLLPQPLHPGVADTLARRLDTLGAASPEDWSGLKQTFADWARGKERQAMDSIAMDRSVRTFDKDGHLHVEMTPISKAVVNPYWGREIPGWQTLRLDPEKTYQLYRDPAELEKAAPSFAGKPLLIIHTPVSADDHPREVTVGTIGDGVKFVDPYLMAPLHVWDGEAIGLIESEEQKELSCGYEYDPDMTPGVVDGVRFDGRMTNIRGNHLALVTEGRAGPDVVVQDAAIKPNGRAGLDIHGDSTPSNGEFIMTKLKLSLMAATANGALLTYLQPKLAQDAKVDLSTVLDGVTAQNFKAKRSGLVAGIKKAVSGKLARDANIDDVDKVLIALDATIEANSAMPVAGKARDKAKDEEQNKLRDFLKDKLSEDDMKACDDIMGEVDEGAMDESEEDDEENEAGGARLAAREKREKDDRAMDSAIKVAADTAAKRAAAETRATERAIRQAEKDCAPFVGDLAMTFDSANDVYRHTLKLLGVEEADTIHESALPTILKMQPKPGARPVVLDEARVPDASAQKRAAEIAPGFGRIKIGA